MPIYIQDVTGWGLMGFEMEICWCDVPAGLLQYEYCLPGEVMTARAGRLRSVIRVLPTA